jgi:hypothetical protein
LRSFDPNQPAWNRIHAAAQVTRFGNRNAKTSTAAQVLLKVWVRARKANRKGGEPCRDFSMAACISSGGGNERV